MCGCVTAPADGTGAARGPKTLLSWNGGGPEPADGAVETEPTKDGGGEDALATDRPDFTEASSTVGRGRVQLESGYTYSRDRDGGTTRDGHSYPEVLLRVGMFADWFELRLGQNFGNSRTGDTVGTFAANGAEDLYVGSKLALTEQKGILPETALVIQASVPTGHRDFTSGQFLPGANYLFGWDVIPDRLTAAGSLQANRAVDGDGHPYAEVAQSFTIGYGLAPKVGAYTEWFAFYPTGATAPDVGPEHYFNAGVTYRLTNDIQFDARAGVGLNRRADDFFTGTGFAVRY